MLPLYFWFGVISLYLFVCILAIDLYYEPWFKKQSLPVRSVEILLMLSILMLCNVAVVFAPAPLEVTSYVRPTAHLHDNVIAGVSWDSHFTDLRVALENTTDNEYHDIDVIITPDNWSYKASMAHSTSRCELSRIDSEVIGVARIGTAGTLTVTAPRIGDMYDSQGNTYSILGTKGGYRLRCPVLPSHFAVEIVFALVSIPNDLATLPATPVGGRGRRMIVSEYSGTNDVFDLLGPKPSAAKVVVSAKYVRGIRPYSFSGRIVNVVDVSSGGK